MFMNSSSPYRPNLARFFSALLLAAVIGPVPQASFADGGGDSDPVIVKPKLKCKKGYVLHKQRNRCVKAKKSSNLDQDSIFDYGRNLAYAGRYDEAIEVLELAPQPQDHRVLNMLGYASRKRGNLDQAFAYYQASISQNRNYALVRAYLGEAYLTVGELELARVQLTEIERICGSRTCDAYGNLADRIVKSQISAQGAG